MIPSIISRLLKRNPSGEHIPQKNEQFPDLEGLTRLVRRFSVEQQQVPKELRELVAMKYLEAVPPAPAGRRFIVDRKRVEVRLE